MRVARTVFLLLAVLVAASAIPVAGQSLDLVGDKDCFGLGVACPDGTLWRDELGGSFFSDYREPDDPAFTDQWFSEADVAFSFSYAPMSVASPFLTLRVAGLADNRGPWDVFYNGFYAGQLPMNTSPDAFQEVLTYSFALNPTWLTGSDNVLLAINDPVATDGYSIDYAELSARTVPEPTTFLLLLSGLLGLAFVVRRRGAAA